MGHITGTGNPDKDLAAILAELQKPEDLILEGTFSLDGDIGVPSKRTVQITKGILIKGILDANGAMAKITGGGGVNQAANPPLPYPAFDVISSDTKPITIQDLIFEVPQAIAIRAQQIVDLTVTGCRIQGVKPVLLTDATGKFYSASGIVISLTSVPTQALISIRDNWMDIGDETSDSTLNIDRTLGIVVIQAAGTKSTEITFTGNHIKTVTGFGIDIRSLFGTARVTGNEIEMSHKGVPKPPFLPSGIRCQKSGTYTVSGNIIDCDYAAGIRLQGTDPTKPMAGALVDSNQVTVRNNELLNELCVGIELRQNCANNEVTRNTIYGLPYYALAVVKGGNFTPVANRFEVNKYGPPTAVVAHVFVDYDVQQTLITSWDPREGEAIWAGFGGFLVDHGTGTKVIGNYKVGPNPNPPSTA